MTSDGCVREALVGDVQVLRIEGSVRYTIAPVVERFLDRVFAHSAIAAVLIDLSGATYLDSTMLGVVARIVARLRAVHGSRPTIVCPQRDLRTLLYSMGFDEVFEIVAQAPPPVVNAAHPVATDGAPTPPSRELARTVLEAHRTLAAMNPHNEAEFHDVVAMMEREVEPDDGA